MRRRIELTLPIYDWVEGKVVRLEYYDEVPTDEQMMDKEWFKEHRRVAETDLLTPFGKVWVSTVFLTIDPSFEEGPPILWETQVFGGLWDDYQWRYSSREDAERGHYLIVDAIKAGKEPDASDPCTNTSTAGEDPSAG